MSDGTEEDVVVFRLFITAVSNGVRETFTIIEDDPIKLVPTINGDFELYGDLEEYVEIRSSTIISRAHTTETQAPMPQPSAEDIAEMGIPREQRGSPHNEEEADAL